MQKYKLGSIDEAIKGANEQEGNFISRFLIVNRNFFLSLSRIRETDLFSLSRERERATPCHIPREKKTREKRREPRNFSPRSRRNRDKERDCGATVTRERVSREVAPTAVLRTIADIASYFIPQIPRVSSFKRCNDLPFVFSDLHLPDSSLPSNFIRSIVLTGT